MTLAAYNGHEALTFTDYIDLRTGRTLHAVPGRSYDVAPASGRVVPEFPEPWFTAVLVEQVSHAAADDVASEEPAGPDEPEKPAPVTDED